MYTIEVNKTVRHITKLFVLLGLWHTGDESTITETLIKFFYSVYYLFFPISLIDGAFTSDDLAEPIFLIQTALIALVVYVKLWYIIWKKKEILEFLNRICVYSIAEQEEYMRVNDKLKTFMKTMSILFCFIIIFGICALLVLPFVGSERNLAYRIGFPLDWKNDVNSYWIAFTFVFTEGILSMISILFSVLVWYMLMNCAFKYEVLGTKLRNMDRVANEYEIYGKEKQNVFRQDLISAIKSHQEINELTGQLESFLAHSFSIQLATSALCICCSVYCLAFDNMENIIKSILYFFYMIYNILDIFMVMYFGNEIKLSSQRLSYCLFESNWVHQTLICNKCTINFFERLKKADQLVILKIYPLTLETFTKILNSAYSMFNILKNFNA